MNKTEFKEVVNASKEKTWDVLFYQYGDIHVHNPTMQSSNYMNNATKGELNCVRHTEFTDKLYLDEMITEVNGNDSFTIVVTEHNLPFVKEMSATYEVSAIENDRTEIKMTSFNSFSPGFMKYLMKGQLKKPIFKHLFGMKYYIETGKTVNKENYSSVFKEYYKS